MADLKRIGLSPKKFRDARKRAGLTQEAAADKIGIGKASISKIEGGKALPSATMLVRFCLLTNASIAELAGRSSRAG